MKKNTQEMKIKNMLAKEMYGIKYDSVDMTKTRIELVDNRFKKMLYSENKKD